MEQLVTIDLPPGVYKNGTRYDAKGRWADSHLIRWREKAMLSVGGWSKTLSTTGAEIVATGFPRYAHAWRSNEGNAWIGVGTTGTPSKIYAFSGSILTDITPAGLVNGKADGSLFSGSSKFGDGPFGAGPYGGSNAAWLVDADTWSIDNFGEFLLACLTSDGKLYSWDKNVVNDAVQMAGSPTGCRALVVTPERFVFALGAGSDPRKVQWPDQESLTDWTPLESNSAGSFILQTPGRLVAGRRAARETLLWTDADLWSAQFVGNQFIYTFQPRGDNCGLLGPNAVAQAEGAAYWMGDGQFFSYDGTTRALECDVADYVFGDLDREQRTKITAVPIPAFGEVWWFYPSRSQTGTENDRYVAYNYRGQFWMTGALGRAAGTAAGVFANPMMWSSSGNLFAHEIGGDRSGVAAPFIESGPLELGEGDRVYRIQRLMPDTGVLDGVIARLLSAFNPTDTEVNTGPISLAAPTPVRVTGRQIRLRLEEDIPAPVLYDGEISFDGTGLFGASITGALFGLGKFRLGVIAGGYR